MKYPYRSLILPDLHIPFQDKWALGQWLAHLQEQEWDGVEIIGDLIDCYSLSKFDKNPARKPKIMAEIEEARTLLKLIRSHHKGDIRYSEGNHEDRLRRYLWRKAPELESIQGLTIPKLLNLEELNIDYHTAGNPYTLGPTTVLHGDCIRKHAGTTARAISDRVGRSVLIGHSHRQGWVPYTSWDGLRDAHEVGHLSNSDLLEYITGVAQWQGGWATHTVHSPTIASVEPVRIVPINKSGTRRGLLYCGELHT